MFLALCRWGCGLFATYQYSPLTTLREAQLPLMISRSKGCRLTQTSQSINPINVHRTTPTDPLSAAPSESKCRIHLVLDSDQRIQHHGSCLVQIKRVRLHPRLGGRLVGIPAIDVEGLDLGVWRSGRLFDCAGLRRGLWVHDRRHAADAHGGPQRGADCREGAGGEACCHYEGRGEWPDLCLFECEGCERALCSIVGRRDN